MERIADYVIKKIIEAGCGDIFFVNGRGILYLTDAVAKNNNLNPISTYHEQGASFAAMAYAAEKNISACLVSTGCAATNAVTACLCAYQDNLPVIFISGNNPLAENSRHTGLKIRTYGSQETDIIEIVKSCTKYAVMLENTENAAAEIEKAIWIARSGRKGPVWIDIPLDVQNMRLESESVQHFQPPTLPTNFDYLETQAEKIVADLNSAERPILLIGGGSKSAKKFVANFAQQIKIPTVFSPAACDIFGAANEISIGAVGSIGGSRAGNFALQNADYVLVLGSKLSSQLTGVRKNFARAAKITVVDIDEGEHKKIGVHIDNFIKSDIAEILTRLADKKICRVNETWLEKCLHWKEIFSIRNEKFFSELRAKDELDIYSVADNLSEILPQDATVITDAGFEELIIPSTIKFKANQRCLFPAAQGAMGYAIPAIIGAYAAGCKNIFCIVGDGSIMMNIQELGLIVAKNIPAKIFVINNNMYAVIRRRQRDLFRSRTIGNDPSDGLPQPDFEKISASVGIKYLKIDSAKNFKSVTSTDFENPALIEVICTPEQKYLHESYALTEKRRLVHRPIEDLSPFLDREIFRSEMIIDMLED